MSDEAEQLKGFTEQIDRLIPALAAMSGKIDKAEKSTSGLGSTMSRTSDSYIAYQRALKEATKGTSKLSKAEQDLLHTAKGLKKVLADENEELYAGHTALNKQLKALRASVAEKKRAAVTAEKSARAERELAKATRTSYETYKMWGKGIKGAGQDAKKFYAFFGAGALSIKNAKDSVVKYNQASFDMVRTFKVSGRGLANMQDAFDIVKDSTTLSRQQFTEFSTAVAQGYTGIVPTTNAIAGLAEILQTQFGPNVERTQEVMKSLLDLFGKFPPALDQIMNIKDVMASAQGGDSKAKEELQILQTTLGLYAQNAGASKKQRQEILQLTTATTKKQRDQLSLNKELKKVEQSSADAILKMGEVIGPSLETIAKGLTSTLNLLESMPKFALGAVAAWQALGMAMGSTIGQASGLKDVMSEKIGGAGKSQGMLGSMGDAIKSRMKGSGQAAESLGPEAVSVAGDDLAGNVKDAADDLLENEEARDAIQTSGVAGREATRNVGVTRREATRQRGAAAMARHQNKIIGGLAVAAIAWESFRTFKETRASFEKSGYSSSQSSKAGTTSAASTGTGAAVGAGLGFWAAGPAGALVGAMVGKEIGNAIGKQINSKMKSSTSLFKQSLELNAQIDNSLGAQLDKWERISAIYKFNVDLLDKQKGYLESQAQILSSLLAVSAVQSSGMFQKAFETMAAELQVVESFLGDMANQRGQMLVDFGVDPNSMDDIDLFVKSLDKVRKGFEDEQAAIEIEIRSSGNEETIKALQGDILVIESKRGVINQEIERSLESQAKKIGLVKVFAELSTKTYTERLSAELAMNSAIEGRINMERDLLEAAHFGMGASIQMMQKQVDLAYENIKANQIALGQQDKEVANAAKLLPMLAGKKDHEKAAFAEKARGLFLDVKSAKSANEQQRMTTAWMDKNEVQGNSRNLLQGVLNQNLLKYNEIQRQSMEQQKKIYDLTKDIREGYLDAIREMSFGFGEFEKIIGTQEMGVTQIMNTVANVTGQLGTANTYNLGGREIAGSEGYNSRTNITGGYRAEAGGAAVFNVGGKDQESRETGGRGGLGIYNFGRDAKKFQMLGMGIGPGATAGLTSSDVAEHGTSIEAVREASESGTEKGAESGIIKGMQKVLVNRSDWWGTAKGVSEGHGAGRDQRNVDSYSGGVMLFSGGVAGMAQGNAWNNPNSPTTAPTEGPLPRTPSQTAQYKYNQSQGGHFDPGQSIYYGADSEAHFDIGGASQGAQATQAASLSKTPNADRFKKSKVLTKQERLLIANASSYEEFREILATKIEDAEEKEVDALILLADSKRKLFNARVKEFMTEEGKKEGAIISGDMNKAFKRMGELGKGRGTDPFGSFRILGEDAARAALEWAKLSEENAKGLDEKLQENAKLVYDASDGNIVSMTSFVEAVSPEQQTMLRRTLETVMETVQGQAFPTHRYGNAIQEALGQLSLNRTKGVEQIAVRVQDIAKTFKSSDDQTYKQMYAEFEKNRTRQKPEVGLGIDLGAGVEQRQLAYSKTMIEAFDDVIESGGTLDERRDMIKSLLVQAGLPDYDEKDPFQVHLVGAMVKKMRLQAAGKEKKEAQRQAEKAKKKSEASAQKASQKAEIDFDKGAMSVPDQPVNQETAEQGKLDGLALIEEQGANAKRAWEKIKREREEYARKETAKSAAYGFELIESQASNAQKTLQMFQIAEEKERVKLRKGKDGVIYNNAGRDGVRSRKSTTKNKNKKMTKEQKHQREKEKYRRLYDKGLSMGQDIPQQYRDPDMDRDFSPEARDKKTREKQNAWGHKKSSRAGSIDTDSIRQSKAPDYLGQLSSAETQANFNSIGTQAIKEQVGLGEALEDSGMGGRAVVEIRLDDDLNAKVTLAAGLGVELSTIS